VSAGGTLLAAAVAFGMVTQWPSSPAARPAAGALTAPGASARSDLLDAVPRASTGPAWSAPVPGFDFDQQMQRTQVLLAEMAEARQAAAQRAAVAAAAAAARAQQQAEQQAAQQQAAPPAVVPSGTAQQIAMSMLSSYGWSSSQFSCLDSLWNVESGWSVTATNPTSGAYGIPQAVPGSKMASAGPDWQTDATTQITWGLDYIQSTYGSPCGAWAHEEADGWY
jgi:type II secretory pathway pseudopilin PulG